MAKKDIFDTVRKEVDKNFNILLKRMNKMVDQAISRTKEKLKTEFKNPRSDITQNDKNVELNIHLPGVKKENMFLKVTDDHVEITAKHTKFKKKESKSKYSEEKEFKGFYRVISLPAQVNSESAKASFHNDLLKIVIPKKKIRKPLVIR